MHSEGEAEGQAEARADENLADPAPAIRRRNDLAIDLVVFVLLLWPLALNGAPFYSEDSSSYLRGGAVGFETGMLILSHWWQSLVGGLPAGGPGSGNPQAVAQAAVAEAGGVRSVIYSVLAYLLRAPGSSLLGLAIAQAGVVTVILSFVRRLIAPGARLGAGIAAGAGVAWLTSAGWYAAYAMPDIFAGVVIGGGLILTLFLDRLGTPARLLLVLLVGLGATFHGSHLPVALCTLAAGAAAHFWLRGLSHSRVARTSLWFASPVVLAILALLATSLVAFDEASLSPKRYPILLARSVADGPGAWHLREHCASERYAICEVFGPQPPRDVGEFLWATGGVRNRASPEQMERIRAEEATIVRRAATEYPLAQAGASASNLAAQFLQLGLTRLNFGQSLVGIDEPVLVQRHADRPWLRTFFEIVVYAGFFGSLALLLSLRRALRPVEIAAVAVALTGLLANAAVCGILSGVTDRYQGRAAWILPALAIAIGLRVVLGRRQRQDRWQPTHT